MKTKSLLLASVLSVSTLLGATATQAAIIDHDTYLTDTETNLDWLDVTTTAGLSFNHVSSEFGSGGDYEGWRYASVAEFNALLFNHTGVAAEPDAVTYTTDTNPSTDLLVALMGSTLDTHWNHLYGMSWEEDKGFAEGSVFDLTIGMLADTVVQDNGDIFQKVGQIYDREDLTLNGNFSEATDFYHTLGQRPGYQSDQFVFGSFLVRDHVAVSEPGSLALLGLGLAGLIGSRRRLQA